jgi:hypothetical protein
MSDQNVSEQREQPSIASNVKEKDPKRVAAGKRLGAISKRAKEAKREAQAFRLERQVETDPADNNYALYFIGGLVVVGTVSYYLYLNKDKKKSSVVPEDPTPTSPPKRKSKRIFGD